jgi:hypothetical protein
MFDGTARMRAKDGRREQGKAVKEEEEGRTRGE